MTKPLGPDGADPERFRIVALSERDPEDVGAAALDTPPLRRAVPGEIAGRVAYEEAMPVPQDRGANPAVASVARNVSELRVMFISHVPACVAMGIAR